MIAPMHQAEVQTTVAFDGKNTKLACYRRLS